MLVAAAGARQGDELARALRAQGLLVAGVAGQDAQVLVRCRELEPDLVLLALDGPGAAASRTLRLVAQEARWPVVLLGDHADQALVAQARAAGVQACLLAPLGDGALGPALELAHQGFCRERGLGGEVDALREALRRRKIMERAKGVLMRQLGLGYAEAEARLNEQAAGQGLSVHEAAAAVVASAQAPPPAGRRRARPSDPKTKPA